MGLSRSKQTKPGQPGQPGFQTPAGYPAQPGFPVQQQVGQPAYSAQPVYNQSSYQQPSYAYTYQTQPFPAMPQYATSAFPGSVFSQPQVAQATPTYPVTYQNQGNQVFSRPLIPGYQANEQRRSNVLVQDQVIEQQNDQYSRFYGGDQQFMGQAPQVMQKTRKH